MLKNEKSQEATPNVAPNKQEILMSYNSMNQLPPPRPNNGYDVKRHNPTVYETRRKEFALKAGGFGAIIGFVASLVTTGYVIDGVINGAFWFGIAYGITRLSQRVKNGEQ